MKLVTPQDQVITCFRIAGVCDYVYMRSIWVNGIPQMYVTDNFVSIVKRDPRPRVSVYCKTDGLRQFFELCVDIDKEIVLVTGSSDCPITPSLYGQKPANIVHWFGENIRHTDPSLESVPCGSVSATWLGGDDTKADMPDHPLYIRYKLDGILAHQKNMMFACFTNSTNSEHRTELAEAFN